ncbi:MAG: hypothetical protein WDN45_12150 [Caulobacteraceae bacterium]
MKEPKKVAAWGAKVAIIAPSSNGTSIIPPGTRSMARLIFIRPMGWDL